MSTHTGTVESTERIERAFAAFRIATCDAQQLMVAYAPWLERWNNLRRHQDDPSPQTSDDQLAQNSHTTETPGTAPDP